MKLKDILNRIPNKEGAGFFTVPLKTIDKDIKIRHLGVNDQKIISKLSINDDAGTFASEADLAKIAIAEEKAVTPIELSNIDVRDYFILCCAIRKENYLDDFDVKYICDNCENEIEKTIDLQQLIDNAYEFELETTSAIINTNIGEMKVDIGIPIQTDLVMLEMYYKRISNTRDVIPAEKYVDYIICCMTNAYFKNDDDQWESIEEFDKMEFLEKVQFIEKVNGNIEEISKLFNDIGMITSNFFYKIECPSCNNKISTFMDTSDFFVL